MRYSASWQPVSAEQFQRTLGAAKGLKRTFSSYISLGPPIHEGLEEILLANGIVRITKQAPRFRRIRRLVAGGAPWATLGLGPVLYGLISLCGCGEFATTAHPFDGAGGTTPSSGNTTGVALTISAKAVQDCGSWQPDHQPELNYQTPENLRLGVMSVQLLRSHKDPDPVSLTLPEAVVAVDASAGGPILIADTGSIPEGSYSHISVGLAYGIYQVKALAHTIMDVSGTLEIDMALSDHEDEPGHARSQGQYSATFSAYGQSSTMSGSTPFNCMLSAWGGIANTFGTNFVVRVPIPGAPVVVDHTAATPLTIELSFPMRDTFAWRDLDGPDFVEGILDLSLPPAPTELPDSMVECHLLMADRCLGEAIVPLHPTWPMPDSNIDFCSDGQQIVQACPTAGEPHYGQDANYDTNPFDYEISEQVVLDRVTDLRWQRTVPSETFDWWEARQYCLELDLAGVSDWRLPSRVELVSLLDFGGLDPTIDPTAFPGTPSDFFWSSSPVPFLNLAFGVRFELGFIYDHDPHSSGRVRCVHGDYQPPEPRFNYDALVVNDQATGLTWQREHLGASTWLAALAACEQLDLGGHEDWRLPTLKELQTLIDDRRLQPSTDVVAFPNTPSEWFWSSTPIEFPPNEGWATSFTDGYASIHSFDELHLVRCVR